MTREERTQRSLEALNQENPTHLTPEEWREVMEEAEEDSDGYTPDGH